MLDLADECCDGAQAMHDFTARCLERNAGARPTPAQLLKHPFLERVRDISYLARALLGGALATASLEGAMPLLLTALGVLLGRAAVLRRVRMAAA